MKLLQKFRPHWQVILFITLLNGAIVWYVTSTKDIRQQHARADRAKQQADYAKKRAVWQKEWAQVLKEKEIAPGETIRLVQVPSPELDIISSRCLIYTNYIFKSAQIVCSDWVPSVSELTFDRIE